MTFIPDKWLPHVLARRMRISVEEAEDYIRDHPLLVLGYRRGVRLVAYADRRPSERIYITVSRVARDGTWADVKCHTWAVQWGKRMSADALLSTCKRQDWNDHDLVVQMHDHEAKLGLGEPA